VRFQCSEFGCTVVGFDLKVSFRGSKRVEVRGIPHLARTPDFLSNSAALANCLRLPLRESRTRGHNGRCVVGNPGSERDAPNFLHAALDRTACAPFFKERRMKLAEPTALHRKSGMWGTRVMGKGERLRFLGFFRFGSGENILERLALFLEQLWN
jgi:hypothetical protein